MKFESLIEFNKYTLALAAGSFLYSIEKLLPPDNQLKQVIVATLLVILLVSLVTGVIVFSAATAASHATAANDNERIKKNQKIIGWSGATHSITLVVALIILAFIFIEKVTTIEVKPDCNLCECKSVSIT